MKPQDYLESILTFKRAEVDQLYAKDYQKIFDQKIKKISKPAFLFSKLLTQTPGLKLIAELKQASPSKGVIKPNFEPLKLAQEYINNGAHCLSILTETHYFKGNLDYIQNVQTQYSIPILRKDFIIDPIQISESKYSGADAILLILAILDPKSAQSLLSLANQQGMDVRFEVHSEKEMQDALTLSGQFMIGINNRNLMTFEVNKMNALNLKTQYKTELAQKITIAESGYTTSEEMDRLLTHNFSAVLIGEGLITNPSLKTYFKSYLSS